MGVFCIFVFCNVSHLQSYFCERCEKYVDAFGREMCVDEFQRNSIMDRPMLVLLDSKSGNCLNCKCSFVSHDPDYDPYECVQPTKM